MELELIEEGKLLIAVAEGSETAFRKLYMQYHNKLGAFIYRLTDSHETSEEIVQDVFIKIWQNRSQLSTIRNFKAYLFIASKNQALNCLKKAVAERSRLLKLENYLEEFYNVNSINEIEFDKYILLDQAIERLPDQQKKVYTLSRHRRLKYAQIAKEMNISVETVKKYLRIATSSISTHVRESVQHQFVVLSSLSFFYFS